MSAIYRGLTTTATACSVVAADLRNDGRLDLLERNAGGGALFLYENQFPTRHYLEISLRGKRSNRLGIGARVIVTASGKTFMRQVFPANSHRSQAPSRAHFGLGGISSVDHLTIRWPSGRVQELPALSADRHIVVDEDVEGEAAVKTVVPGKGF